MSAADHCVSYQNHVYLEGFSENQKELYAFDLEKEALIKGTKPLSEFSVSVPDFAVPLLTRFEETYSLYRKKLVTKAGFEENYGTNCLLDKEEKEFWYVWLLLQLLCNEDMLRLAEHTAQELYGDTPAVIAKVSNPHLAVCMELVTDPIQQNILLVLYNLLFDMKLVVGADKSLCLMTCDNPVHTYQHDDGMRGIDGFSCALTSSVVLFALKKNVKDMFNMESLFALYSEMVTQLNQNVIVGGQQLLYSETAFDQEDLAFIKKVRKLHRRENRENN